MDDSGRLNVSRLIKTKIVCTLGPVSSSEEVLRKMVEAGMDCVRLNFSHGTQEDHRKLFQLVKHLSQEYNNQISIMCDIQGPKIRTGRIMKPFTISPEDKILVTPHEITGTPEAIQIKYETMLEDLVPGDTIFINDGIIKLRVLEKGEFALQCVCEAGGVISDHKGCNIPSGNISLNVITPKDERDLRLIAELNPEYVASSFIGSAADVLKVREMLSSFGNSSPRIISKIERPVALQNIDEIIEVTDGIMVARGDLGVEINTWDVPTAQKMMCKKCNAAGKPVIVATQMLESMINSSRPTRAEANDVYNAVLDGADAVMLSGETTIGKYPLEAIKVMDDIVAEAEKHLPRRIPTDYHSLHVGCDVDFFQHFLIFQSDRWQCCHGEGRVSAQCRLHQPPDQHPLWVVPW
eukprot:TRINITY_DN6279_c0_g1_i2.p1 TRINITY_DN6279_c0_g1~~TRINITY_DN6279_c0_g1_i2.p1  ORF type:complete len:439 (+),score=91.93 TRINITY_DN6279_c0_g1_i2:96-1319(+)